MIRTGRDEVQVCSEGSGGENGEKKMWQGKVRIGQDIRGNQGSGTSKAVNVTSGI